MMHTSVNCTSAMHTTMTSAVHATSVHTTMASTVASATMAMASHIFSPKNIKYFLLLYIKLSILSTKYITIYYLKGLKH